MEIFIEKKAVGFMKFPMLYVVVKTTKKKTTVKPLHGTTKAESIPHADFEARFMPKPA
jgi:hypothetical protein